MSTALMVTMVVYVITITSVKFVAQFAPLANYSTSVSLSAVIHVMRNIVSSLPYTIHRAEFEGSPHGETSITPTANSDATPLPATTITKCAGDAELTHPAIPVRRVLRWRAPARLRVAWRLYIPGCCSPLKL